jgi:3-hydroxyacyl-CoA dehydrogenase
MSTLTHYEVRDDVAVITLDSPPVNGLGQAMRQAIQTAFRQAVSDLQVQAIVIASAGKLFCGGADISEFGWHCQTNLTGKRLILNSG